jgi:hypothetical protein
VTPMVWAAKGSADLLQMIDNDSVVAWQNRAGARWPPMGRRSADSSP